jgi:hypothetical protein
VPSVSYLTELDQIRNKLAEQFPGWQIWYVPHSDRTVAWCARPWPLLNAQTPEHLIAEITQAHTEASADWPALASLDDYGRAAPGIPRAGR